MLLNLLLPVMHNYFTPKPYFKLNIILSALIIIGALWGSLAIYLYFESDFSRSKGAIISAGVSLLAAAIVAIVAFTTRRKVADTTFDNIFKSVEPAIAQVNSVLKSTKVKMALPLAALIAGYIMVGRKK
jgi:hypothetical protein